MVKNIYAFLILGGDMAEHRHDKRIDTNETCILRLRDIHYVATVTNISFGGALLHFFSPPLNLHVGDNCNISIHDEFLGEYACEVVRYEAPYVALSFTGMTKLRYVEH
jgi:PilZ domain